MEIGESNKAAEARSSNKFPVGMRVVAVDDDPICLVLLNKLLTKCQYQVTCFTDAIEALKAIKENKDEIDLVITDVHMPKIDGFQLLQIAAHELKLPVIILSANDTKKSMMKGVMDGACDYLIKPIRFEELSVIWKHVARSKSLEVFDEEPMDNDDAAIGEYNDQRRQRDTKNGNSARLTGKRRKKASNETDSDDIKCDVRKSATTKPRVIWSTDLHNKFVDALSEIGVDKAVPKSILNKMSTENLTRENVASHLQKYRLYLKRVNSDPKALQAAFSSGSLGIDLRPLELFKNFHSHGHYRVLSSNSSPSQSTMPNNRTSTNSPSSSANIVPSSQITQASAGSGLNNISTSDFTFTNNTMNNSQMNQSGMISFSSTSNGNYFSPFNSNSNYMSMSSSYSTSGLIPFAPFEYPMTNVPPISNPNSIVGPIFGASPIGETFTFGAPPSQIAGTFTFGIPHQQSIFSFNNSSSVPNPSITGNLNDINDNNSDNPHSAMSGTMGSHIVSGAMGTIIQNSGMETEVVSGGMGADIMNGAMGTDIVSVSMGASIISCGMRTDIVSSGIGNSIMSGGMSGDMSGGLGYSLVNDGMRASNVSEGMEIGTETAGTGTGIANAGMQTDFVSCDVGTNIANDGIGTGTVGGGIECNNVSDGMSGGLVNGPMGFGLVSNDVMGLGNVSSSMENGIDMASSNLSDDMGIGSLTDGMGTSIATEGMSTGDVSGSIRIGPVSPGGVLFGEALFGANDNVIAHNNSDSLYGGNEISISGLDEFLASLQTSDINDDAADLLAFMYDGFFN